jgi:hypothetical protein
MKSPPAFLSVMQSGLCVAMALGVLCHLPVSHAVKSTVKPVTYGDGWSLYDEAIQTDITHASVPGLWDIGWEKRPLLEASELPPTVHPLMKALNRYQVLTFKPNPALIDWQQDIEINGERQTANIVNQVRATVQAAQQAQTSPAVAEPAFEPPVQSPELTIPVPKEAGQTPPPELKEKARLSVGDALRKTGKGIGVVLGGILAIPVALVVLLLCSPFLVASAVGNTKTNIEAGKKQRGNERLKKELGQAEYMVKQINSLQQQFNAPDATSRARTRYHLLPDLNHYTVHLLGKDILYRPVYRVNVNFRFKHLYAAPKLEAAVQGKPMTLYLNTMTTDALPGPVAAELKTLPPGTYAHACFLQLNADHARQAENVLTCQTVEQTRQ